MWIACLMVSRCVSVIVCVCCVCCSCRLLHSLDCYLTAVCSCRLCAAVTQSWQYQGKAWRSVVNSQVFPSLSAVQTSFVCPMQSMLHEKVLSWTGKHNTFCVLLNEIAGALFPPFRWVLFTTEKNRAESCEWAWDGFLCVEEGCRPLKCQPA